MEKNIDEVKVRVIKQVLFKNGFTVGLVNKFVSIAKTDRNNRFYMDNLDRVLNIRTQLLEKDIILTQLEEIFENSNFKKRVGA